MRSRPTRERGGLAGLGQPGSLRTIDDISLPVLALLALPIIFPRVPPSAVALPVLALPLALPAGVFGPARVGSGRVGLWLVHLSVADLN
jgi:hypothetical protein